MWYGQIAQLTIWRQLEAAALMELPVGVEQLTVQPATGHIFMSKPTNMARCLQKQTGLCKQISGCRQNGLMISLPEANSAETNGSSMQLIPPLGSVLGSAILKLWRCTKRRRPWNATHQSFGKRSPPCARKGLGAQTCSNKPRQDISPYFGSSFVGPICFPPVCSTFDTHLVYIYIYICIDIELYMFIF